MNHCPSQEQISAYYDKALSAEQTVQIKEHLTSCDKCHAELDSLASLGDLFASSALPTLRPLALEQMHQQLDKDINTQLRQQAERGPLKLASWLTAVAAVVLIASSIQLFMVQSNLGNTNSASEFAPSLAWETTTAMLNQQNPADPAVSDEHSFAAWIVSDLTSQASSTSPLSTQE